MDGSSMMAFSSVTSACTDSLHRNYTVHAVSAIVEITEVRQQTICIHGNFTLQPRVYVRTSYRYFDLRRVITASSFKDGVQSTESAESDGPTYCILVRAADCANAEP